MSVNITMNDFYTFVITSTINTDHGKFSPPERFNQTLETIESIRTKVPNSVIVFADNSLHHMPEDVVSLLKSKVNLYIDYKHNLFSKFINGDIQSAMHKGVGEMMIFEQVMFAIRENNLIGKRIFKISGRYRLSDTFDITQYDNVDYVGKYIFKPVTWAYSKDNFANVEHRVFLETRLWSFCGSLFNEYEQLIQECFNYMLVHSENLEVTNHTIIPHDKVIQLNEMNVEGYFGSGAFIKD